jgi:hypothetical protein
MLTQLSAPAECYVRTINGHDAATFLDLFAGNARVDDVGREFRGLDAIKQWSDREIFAAQVTLPRNGPGRELAGTDTNFQLFGAACD